MHSGGGRVAVCAGRSAGPLPAAGLPLCGFWLQTQTLGWGRRHAGMLARFSAATQRRGRPGREGQAAGHAQPAHLTPGALRVAAWGGALRLPHSWARPVSPAPSGAASSLGPQGRGQEGHPLTPLPGPAPGIDSCCVRSAHANQTLPLPISISLALPQGCSVRPGERHRDARPGPRRLLLGGHLSEVPAAGLGRPAPEGHPGLYSRGKSANRRVYFFFSLTSLPSPSYFSPSPCVAACPSVSLSPPRLQVPESYSKNMPQTGKAPPSKNVAPLGRADLSPSATVTRSGDQMRSGPLCCQRPSTLLL